MIFIIKREEASVMKSFLGETKVRLSLVALILYVILCNSCGLFNNTPVINGLEVERDHLR